MTPHAPNLFALSAGVRPSDPGTSAVYHSSSSTDAIDHTAAVMGDKKRARPPEGATRARKKVASELMAFEFESLSLSAPAVAPARTDQAPTRRSAPEQSATAEHQNVHRQQQQQQQQELPGHARQYQQYHHQAHQHHQRSQGHCAVEDQRTGESHRGQGHGARPRSFTTSTSTSSAASSSSSSTPRHGRPGHVVSTHIYTHEDRLEMMTPASTPSAYSAFSPPSPPISPLPSARPTNMDVSMNMDEGMVDGFRSSLSNSGKEAPKSVGTPEMHTSNVRTLNLRQRKWNSVRKEWQEWHDVQATHASDTPLTTRVLDTNATIRTGASGNAGSEIDTSALSHETSMIQTGFEAPESNVKGSPLHSQSSGLGRQRSLNEARGKSKVEQRPENTQEEQRTSIGPLIKWTRRQRGRAISRRKRSSFRHTALITLRIAHS
ncbi:hypothetical protein BGZ67_007651 [Mortierella alpina]|nr:hypothetical protein BGZ67_007651 [Mortierella alpina]